MANEVDFVTESVSSVLSLSSEEDEETRAKNVSRQQNSKQLRKLNNTTITPRAPIVKLGEIKVLEDIESYIDKDVHQAVVLDQLEQKWQSMSENLETVLNHLQECSDQVTQATLRCWETTTESVNVTCDSVVEETQALYKLMSKCDELAIQLTVASSFCDEIKTLKKSVDTLDQLYKTKPHHVAANN